MYVFKCRLFECQWHNEVSNHQEMAAKQRQSGGSLMSSCSYVYRPLAGERVV